MHPVAQAITRNPFVIIVSCHRVLCWNISKRRLLSIEGARGPVSGKTLFDVLLPVAPPRPHG